MTEDSPHQATRLLERWRSGDEGARDRLLSLLHDEMREIASRLMRSERSGHTLQATAVVNEACLRLLGVADGPAHSRAEFLGLAAHVMRRVLVDHARRRDSEKRGGDAQRVALTVGTPSGKGASQLIDALDLDEALDRLARLSPRQARVAELRYFGGYSVEETAEILGVSERTVKGDWRVARAWLREELGGSSRDRATEA